ncbi:MAG: glycosyltransferase family 39 protein [Acidobacteriota bacterium]|nr:MAG: glycosyltransferase family 39 protein [Acidobacteriota bacterium]
MVWAWHLDGYGYFASIALNSSRAAQHLLEGQGFAVDREGMPVVAEAQNAYGVLIEPLFYPPLSANVEPVLGYMPGYVLGVAAVFSLVEAQYFPVRLVQALVDSAACVLLFSLAWQMLGLGVARVAGVLYALWPPIAVSSVLAHADAFMVPLTVFMLWAVWRAVKGGGYRWWLLSALVVAAQSYFRPTVLLFAPFLAAASFASAEKNRWKSATVVFVLTTIVIGSCLLPWGFYNWQRTGHFLLTSTSAGWALWAALGECQNPWGVVVDDQYMQARLAEKGYRWHSVEADQFLKREFTKAFMEHPLFYAKTYALRFAKVLFPRHFWGFVPEVTPEGVQSFMQREGMVLGAVLYFQSYARPFVERLLNLILQGFDWVLLGVAAAGGVLLWRQNRRRALTVACLPFAYFLLTGPIMHVEPRYILPMEITYVLLASVALREWWNASKPLGRAS